jgi:hypothetical protein
MPQLYKKCQQADQQADRNLNNTLLFGIMLFHLAYSTRYKYSALPLRTVTAITNDYTTASQFRKST